MTGTDEQELRGRLDTALMTITPRPAPIDAVMRQGRHVMYRRRVSVAAGLAVIAAALVAAPAWLHAEHSESLQAKPPVVTVVLPGQGSPAGLIAFGKVGTKRWGAKVTPDKNGQFCVQTNAMTCSVSPSAVNPADIQGSTDAGVTVKFGTVKPTVTRVTVRLGDGQLLVLHPVKVLGTRWIAFPLPLHVGIIRATAYAGRSEIGYAIPFDGAPGLPSPSVIFGLWLKPGDTPHPRGTFQIGSGVLDGKSWAEKEYVGPWGHCFAAAGEGLQLCVDGFGSELNRAQLVSMIMAAPGGKGPGPFMYEVASSVARVTVTVSDGEVLRPAVSVGDGGLKYIYYNIGQGRPLRWTAYDAAGHQLGSGNAGITG